MKRKDFIRYTGAGAVLLGAGSFPYEALAAGDATKLTLLHTNDQHSRIEPFPMDGGKYQGLGGFARRAALINNIRSEEKHVILLDSGDVFQGTPYFNKYLGELEIKLMSEMKYDASTFGNHDFDAGMAGFAKQYAHANFPFLNANYNFKNTLLEGKIDEYKIFKRGNIKVGVFGIGIELDGLVPPDLYGETKYNDPISNANRVAAILKHDHKCNLVICLSHLGYKYDTNKVSDVAMAQQTSNIDVILGGHTHTLFAKPEEYQNAAGQKTIVNQVGWAGIYLGRLDFYFEEKKNALLISGIPKLVSE